jgi:hypothetical protein
MTGQAVIYLPKLMRLFRRALPLAALLAAAICVAAEGQAPPPAPAPTPQSTPAPEPAPAVAPATTPVAAPAPETAPPAATATAPAAPTPAAPAPAAATALQIHDTPVIFVARLPLEDPFGSTAQVPAALPQKLNFVDGAVSVGYFASVHVDPAGKAVAVRRERDPIPSLSAEALKSLARWVFAPARKAGQPVEVWGAYRIELYTEIRAPKILQMAMVPITPSTPISTPLSWPSDEEWLESRHPPSAADGTTPLDQVDTAAIPQKTPWSADSYKGPFSVKFWVRVDKTGRIDRAIPIEISDPILLSYFRKAMGTWALRPAQSDGAPVESWNELTLGGQISFSPDIKQIAALRKPIGS